MAVSIASRSSPPAALVNVMLRISGTLTRRSALSEPAGVLQAHVHAGLILVRSDGEVVAAVAVNVGGHQQTAILDAVDEACGLGQSRRPASDGRPGARSRRGGLRRVRPSWLKSPMASAPLRVSPSGARSVTGEPKPPSSVPGRMTTSLGSPKKDDVNAVVARQLGDLGGRHAVSDGDVVAAHVAAAGDFVALQLLLVVSGGALGSVW